VTITDESGTPIAATVTTGGTTLHGVDPVRVPLSSRPALAVVSAPDFLAEPVPLGLEDVGRTVPVRLLSDHGGKRFILHSAGDVMFGRRYQDAPALVPATTRRAARTTSSTPSRPRSGWATCARSTSRPSSAPLPRRRRIRGKRFILQSPPATTEGLKRLGVDVPSLANNHTRDFQDAGLADTTKALTAAGFPIVGLADSDRPQPAYDTRIRGNDVTMLAYTSVDGSFVNNSHPHDDTPRQWGFDPLVPDAARTTRDRILPAPRAWYAGGQTDGNLGAWLANTLAGNAPDTDVLDIAMQYRRDTPDLVNGNGIRYAGRAFFGPVVAGERITGSDFVDYLGVPWTYDDGVTQEPDPLHKDSLDCSGFLRMVFGYRSGYPVGRAPGPGVLPRTV